MHPIITFSVALLFAASDLTSAAPAPVPQSGVGDPMTPVEPPFPPGFDSYNCLPITAQNTINFEMSITSGGKIKRDPESQSVTASIYHKRQEEVSDEVSPEEFSALEPLSPYDELLITKRALDPYDTTRCRVLSLGRVFHAVGDTLNTVEFVLPAGTKTQFAYTFDSAIWKVKAWNNKGDGSFDEFQTLDEPSGGQGELIVETDELKIVHFEINFSQGASNLSGAMALRSLPR